MSGKQQPDDVDNDLLIVGFVQLAVVSVCVFGYKLVSLVSSPDDSSFVFDLFVQLFDFCTI